jgi:hypothetical protein
MSNKNHVIACLETLEEKHIAYFTRRGIGIFDCVNIIDEGMVTVHVTGPKLPFEIGFDIESVLWID